MVSGTTVFLVWVVYFALFAYFFAAFTYYTQTSKMSYVTITVQDLQKRIKDTSSKEAIKFPRREDAGIFIIYG